MFKKKCVKIGIVFLVLTVIVVINTNTFGAINVKYYKDIVEDLNVIDGALDSKVKGSILLDAIAVLVYSVGSLMEWILGGIFQALSGGAKVFPWADAILFNAIPLLDVNVFNPSGASLVGIMQEFISSAYWTVFYLALSFLGIAIMVTAIKLAISTIASDKAQYKQAIVKWIMGFIMLWGIHFFMSFVLYLNEGLVEYASVLAQEETKQSSIDLAKLRDSSQSDLEIVRNFVTAMTDNHVNVLTILGYVAGIAAVVAMAVVGWPASLTTGIVWAIAGATVVGGGAMVYNGTKVSISEFATAKGAIINTVIQGTVKTYDQDSAIEYISHKDTLAVAARLLKNEDYVNSLQARCENELLADSEQWTWHAQSRPEAIRYLAADVSLVIRNTYKLKDDSGSESEKMDYNMLLNSYLEAIKELSTDDILVSKEYDIKNNFKAKDPVGLPGQTYSDDEVNHDQMLEWYCKAMTYARADYLDRQGGGAGVADKSNIISTLAKAFKEMAWTNTATSWKPSKPVIQGALLYAILVAQSLIFFISYAKRLFYVIILILMAPVIVVYDFFTKFSS